MPPIPALAGSVGTADSAMASTGGVAGAGALGAGAAARLGGPPLRNTTSDRSSARSPSDGSAEAYSSSSASIASPAARLAWIDGAASDLSSWAGELVATVRSGGWRSPAGSINISRTATATATPDQARVRGRATRRTIDHHRGPPGWASACRLGSAAAGSASICRSARRRTCPLMSSPIWCDGRP